MGDDTKDQMISELKAAVVKDREEWLEHRRQWARQNYAMRREELTAQSRASYRRVRERLAQSNPEALEELKRKHRKRVADWRIDQGIAKVNAIREATKLARRTALVGPKPDVCSVCGRGDKISFDHCHKTNKARGWLCNKCNVALGLVDDDPDILRKLIDYLGRDK